MKSKFITCLFIAALPMAQSLSAKDTLTVITADEPLTFDAASTTTITFAGGKTMNVVHAGGETEIALADVSEIVFDIEAASNESLTADLNDGVTLNIDGTTVSALSSTDKAVTLEAFTAGGVKVASVTGKTASIDFSSKAGGVYILRCNEKTIKYFNR